VRQLSRHFDPLHRPSRRIDANSPFLTPTRCSCLGTRYNHGGVRIRDDVILTVRTVLFNTRYSTTLFAYGQTGSGKTYSISGVEDVIVDDSYSGGDPREGVVPRVARSLFDQMPKFPQRSVPNPPPFFERLPLNAQLPATRLRAHLSKP
jgi:hypothetical protein